MWEKLLTENEMTQKQKIQGATGVTNGAIGERNGVIAGEV